MNQRRLFLKYGFGGIFAAVVSSSVFELFGKPYKIQIVYTFESELMRESLLPQIENIGLIHSINQKYEQSGQIQSFSHERYENLAINTYVFKSERSYLDWRAEMSLAKVMNKKYCTTMVAQRGDPLHLGEEGKDLNKRILFEVRSTDKAPA